MTVYDAETAGDGHFLVMEYVPGTDLAQTVVARPAAGCGRLRLHSPSGPGLQHAHEHGMVHRDITPRNLMLTGDGRVKILDFGLAYFVSEAKTIDRLACRVCCWGASTTCRRSRRPTRIPPTSAPTFTAWAARSISC